MTTPQSERSPEPSPLDIYLALSHIGDASGPLAPLPGEAEEETPRVYVARALAGEWRLFIRPDVPALARQRLLTLGAEAIFAEPESAATLLVEAGAPPEGIWTGRTLLFPDDLDETLTTSVIRLPDGIDAYDQALPDGFSSLREVAPASPQEIFPARQFAVTQGGLVVSTCESSRESIMAAEAWTRTLSAYRGQGFATRATAAWALDARQRGKIPFYSHHRANAASAGVARALRLIPFLEDVGVL